MLLFVIRRILLAVPTLLIVVTVVFVAVRVVPGDPAIVVLGDHVSQQALEALRERMGLNQPLWKQYVDYVSAFARGDFGTSLVSDAPILPQLRTMLPFSLELAIAGMVLGFVIGLPLGIVTAIRKNSALDYVGRIVALAGISTPAFVLGIVLLLIFALGLGWFPVISGSADALRDPVRRLHNLVLPAFTIGLIEAAFVARLTRAAFLEIMAKQYMVTAKSKGLRRFAILLKHGLRNALIPIVTIVGTNIGALLGGAILTETVFNRPGLGKLLLGAILQRDYTLVQASVLTFASFVIVVNLLVDITYSVVDPRIRYA